MFEDITTPQVVEDTEEITLRLPIEVIEKFTEAAELFQKEDSTITPERLMSAVIQAMHQENILQEIVLSMLEETPASLDDFIKSPEFCKPSESVILHSGEHKELNNVTAYSDERLMAPLPPSVDLVELINLNVGNVFSKTLENYIEVPYTYMRKEDVPVPPGE